MVHIPLPSHLQYLSVHFRPTGSENPAEYIERLEFHYKRHQKQLKKEAIDQIESITDRLDARMAMIRFERHEKKLNALRKGYFDANGEFRRGRFLSVEDMMEEMEDEELWTHSPLQYEDEPIDVTDAKTRWREDRDDDLYASRHYAVSDDELNYGDDYPQ